MPARANQSDEPIVGEKAGKRISMFRFAKDSPVEGAGFEPSVPRERVCAFRDHVHSPMNVEAKQQAVRRCRPRSTSLT